MNKNQYKKLSSNIRRLQRVESDLHQRGIIINYKAAWHVLAINRIESIDSNVGWYRLFSCIASGYKEPARFRGASDRLYGKLV